MSYRDEIVKAMNMLGENPRTIFIGQNVVYSGATTVHETLKDIPADKKIELPVMEDVQMGISIGLALEGFIPVSIYPRMDFLMLAMNQLVNHLDKIEEMSCGRFKPKVIIRTCVGSTKPLHPGPQHSQDHTSGVDFLLQTIEVVRLTRAERIMPAYKRAMETDHSTVLVELSENMRD